MGDPKDGIKQHLLAATNWLIGSSNFLIVGLPEGWRVANGIAPPEVFSTTQCRGAAWVANGRSYHILYQPEERLQLELEVHIEKGSAPISAGPGAELVFDGHPAAYRGGERKKGLWGRRVLKTGRLDFFCDKTKRQVRLEMVGECSPETLTQLAQTLAQGQCH